jgi:hypothetical protein
VRLENPVDILLEGPHVGVNNAFGLDSLVFNTWLQRLMDRVALVKRDRQPLLGQRAQDVALPRGGRLGAAAKLVKEEPCRVSQVE